MSYLIDTHITSVPPNPTPAPHAYKTTNSEEQIKRAAYGHAAIMSFLCLFQSSTLLLSV